MQALVGSRDGELGEVDPIGMGSKLEIGVAYTYLQF